MEGLLQESLLWVEQHPHAFTIAVFITALFESLVVLGLLIPGAALLFGAGALMATGALPVGPIMLWTIAGAICGDTISFLLGRHYHQRLRVVWPFRRYPRLVNRGVDFFVRHGGKSVFMARFIGPLRPIVPAIAGMMNMSIPRFLAVDTAASILWAPVYILPGMVFGASLGLAAEVAGRLVVLLVAIAVVAWLGFWVIGSLIRIIRPHAINATDRLLEWSRTHPLIRPLAGSLLDPQHPEARGLAILSVVFFVTLWLLFLTSRQVLHGHLLSGIDSYLFHTLAGLRTPIFDSFMLFVTQFGEQLLLAGVLCLAVAWLLVKGYTKAALHWLLVYATAGLLTWFLKISVQVARPNPMIEGFSYPSAHTSMSIAVYGFLALMIAREMPVQRRWLPYSVAGLLVSLIALSRIYLGFHWFSDILAGASLGILWVALVGIAYDRHPAPRLPVKRLLLVTVVLTALAGTMQTQQSFDERLASLRPVEQQQEITADAWRSTGWATLPAWRADLEGSRAQPMNVQWAGSLETLTGVLAAAGWEEPEGAGPLNAMNWLAPEPLPADLPVLPQVHAGQHQQLLLRAPLADDDTHMLVLRLWPSALVLTDGTPVWVGNASLLYVEKDLPMMSFLRTAEDFDSPLAFLKRDLVKSGRLDIEKKLRSEAETSDQWQGSVLLGWAQD